MAAPVRITSPRPPAAAPSPSLDALMEQFLQGITSNTEDVKEGRQSFLERREPVFKGR